MKTVIAGLLLAFSASIVLAGEAPQPETDQYQQQLSQLFEWSRQSQSGHDDQAAQNAAEQPVSVADLKAAVQTYKADPSADLSLGAMQLVYYAADIAAGEQQEYAKQQVNQIYNLVLEHQVDNPKLFGMLIGISRSTGGVEFLESVFARVKNKQMKAQVADLIVDQAVSILYSDKLSQQERAAHKARGERYARLYIDELSDAVPNMEISGKNIPLNLWRVKGALFDLQYLGLGQKLPNLQAVDLEGQQDGTDNYAGKVMLIDFWTTWCGPCKASLPHIAEMTEDLKDKPFQMISVACDQEVEPVIEFREEEQSMPWVNWHLPALTEEGERTGTTAYPTYFVVDAEGVIRMKTHSFDEAEPLVRQLAAEAASN